MPNHCLAEDLGRLTEGEVESTVVRNSNDYLSVISATSQRDEETTIDH